MSQKFTPEKMARLRAEAKNPYRSLRQFIYLCFGLSGGVGGMIFLLQIAAGRDLDQAIPNLAVQAGVVGLMIFLWRWENKKKLASQEKE
ncbi:DUF3493 domain-containing protein [Picosynechococcus sp. PCC 73109]|uniref:DUF3493 domain-containing protein n=1 Tax=Picosynechococcus sp. PCC 73109 TaxID=374982 RepID=UPI0007458A5F|nr:DUF3493 domain-containing protein [Picosynechococcus sp. PCC 73109]AMA08391.1 hypothetical protein AWQ23_03130 [Picosynechococcus sp. PCC 73109]